VFDIQEFKVCADLSRVKKELAREDSVIQQEVSRHLGALEVVLTGMVGLYQPSDEVTEVVFSTLVRSFFFPILMCCRCRT
jgi:hypothetical protein